MACSVATFSFLGPFDELAEYTLKRRIFFLTSNSTVKPNTRVNIVKIHSCKQSACHAHDVLLSSQYPPPRLVHRRRRCVSRGFFRYSRTRARTLFISRRSSFSRPFPSCTSYERRRTHDCVSSTSTGFLHLDASPRHRSKLVLSFVYTNAHARAHTLTHTHVRATFHFPSHRSHSGTPRHL